MLALAASLLIWSGPPAALLCLSGQILPSTENLSLHTGSVRQPTELSLCPEEGAVLPCLKAQEPLRLFYHGEATSFSTRPNPTDIILWWEISMEGAQMSPFLQTVHTLAIWYLASKSFLMIFSKQNYSILKKQKQLVCVCALGFIL